VLDLVTARVGPATRAATRPARIERRRVRSLSTRTSADATPVGPIRRSGCGTLRGERGGVIRGRDRIEELRKSAARRPSGRRLTALGAFVAIGWLPFSALVPGKLPEPSFGSPEAGDSREALASASSPGRSPNGSSVGPPRPIVRSGGRRLRAARGSSCWTTSDQEVRVTMCADRRAPRTKRALSVLPGRRLRVDMRTSTLLLRTTLRRGHRRLRQRGLDDSGRRWLVRLPREMPRRVVLDLFARYSKGDGSFGVTLRRRQ